MHSKLKKKSDRFNLATNTIDENLKARINAFCSENEISDNTRRAYTSGIKYFWGWAKIVHGLEEAYPIAEDVVIDYVLSHIYGLSHDVNLKMISAGFKTIEGVHKISAIRSKVRALSYAHKQANIYDHACNSKIISMLLFDGKRRRTREGVVKKQSRAITKDILTRMVRRINTRNLEGVRDRAILEFGFYTGGRRRSEIARSEFRFLHKVRGGYEYFLHTSKTDQVGKGAVKPLRTEYAGALKAWIDRSGISDGYLFRKVANGMVLPERIVGAYINTNIVKRYISEIGEDDRKYTAHGLRRGFITQCGRDRKSIYEVMALTGHKDVRQLMEYYEEGLIWANSASKI